MVNANCITTNVLTQSHERDLKLRHCFFSAVSGSFSTINNDGSFIVSSISDLPIEKRENVEKMITKAEIESQKLALSKLNGQTSKMITMANRNQRSRVTFMVKNLSVQNNSSITNARKVGIEKPAK